MEGVKYTRNNKQDDTFTKERLDKVVANTQWVGLFKEREVEVLNTRKFDHKPILLMVYKEDHVRRNRKRLFRFEAKWVLEEESGTIIEEAWARNIVE